MPTFNPSVGTRSALTVTGFGTLASATYVTSSAINHDTAKEPDLLVEVEAAIASGTLGANKQVVVFAKASLDGTNFSSGPESGTSVTDEPDLYFVGVVPINSVGVTHRRVFSLAAAFGGRLPKQSKIVLKNDAGLALTSGAVYTAPATDTIA